MGRFQLFSAQERDSLRSGGAILRGCLEHVASLVRPGIETQELDREAESYIISRGGKPAFKGYRGFPGTLCISVNEECVHGIPGPRVLAEGEIVSLDGGVIYDHLYTDSCVSVAVGTVSREAERLLAVTSQALEQTVPIIRAGCRIGDISASIQTIVEDAGFTPVRSLTGHGLGAALHQFPDIPNSGRAGTGPILPAGTLIAVEPIVSAGSDAVVQGADGWTLSIEDGALAAHFEHTLFITDDGCEVIA